MKISQILKENNRQPPIKKILGHPINQWPNDYILDQIEIDLKDYSRPYYDMSKKILINLDHKYDHKFTEIIFEKYNINLNPDWDESIYAISPYVNLLELVYTGNNVYFIVMIMQEPDKIRENSYFLFDNKEMRDQAIKYYETDSRDDD